MSFSTVTIISICVFCLVLIQFDLSHAKEITRNSKSSSGGLLFREKRSPRQLKLCGNQLINMLGIICRVYSSNKDNTKYAEDLESNSVYYRKKRSLENYSNSLRRHVAHFVSYIEQGLSSQCCVSSCSLRQLRLAC